MIGSAGPVGRRRVVGREVRAKRAAVARVGYTRARSAFQSGDVLLFRGRGIPSFLIRMVTRSPYSHVGLVFLYVGHVYCLEAVGSGVRLTLMSEEMRRYHGGIDYYEVTRATPEQRDGAVAFWLA